ncbi:MAG: serine hydrolase [Flavobacteriales bacterium]|nr:serine hydrolase [Flavobacteriales bacterium]
MKWISMSALMIMALTSCHVGRYFIYNFADVRDHKKFQSRPLTASPESFQFHETDNGKYPKEVTSMSFEEYLEEHNTVAFMIIQNDTIHYENYFKGYSEESIVHSFSMAKSVTSMLIGCAIDDGFIQSVYDPLTKYIPVLKEEGFDKVTIENTLQMTSGVDYNESYVNPFGDAAAFYYGRNLRKLVAKMELETDPGTRWQYVSGDTQLLGLVLERALGGKSVTDYLQEKIWTPLEMEYDASWSIDKKNEGMEKTFCCINARARDYAKLGRLYMNKGVWNGERIISEEWIEQSTKLDTSNGSVDFYQYQWWLPTPGKDFMAEGILGQFIYVHPEKNLIIVRLGKNEGHTNWWSLFTGLAESY